MENIKIHTKLHTVFSFGKLKFMPGLHMRITQLWQSRPVIRSLLCHQQTQPLWTCIPRDVNPTHPQLRAHPSPIYSLTILCISFWVWLWDAHKNLLSRMKNEQQRKPAAKIVLIFANSTAMFCFPVGHQVSHHCFGGLTLILHCSHCKFKEGNDATAEGACAAAVAYSLFSTSNPLTCQGCRGFPGSTSCLHAVHSCCNKLPLLCTCTARHKNNFFVCLCMFWLFPLQGEPKMREKMTWEWR